jgi:nitrogen regulatory protein P-II 1
LARGLLCTGSRDDGSSNIGDRIISGTRRLQKVEAIVRHSALFRVRDLLGRVGVDGMTITQVFGVGHEKGTVEDYRGHPEGFPYVQRYRIEIVVEEGRVPALVQELIRATRTGKVGDGKIFVFPVSEAVRIRTNERGRDAL